MISRSFTFLSVLTAIGVLGFGAAAAGRPPVDAKRITDQSTSPCFFVTQWRGWKAPDAHTLYLGIDQHDVYQVDLSADSPDLLWPDMHLVSIVRGSSSICSHLDLDLKIADNNGFSSPLIARSMRKLTPEEVAAIPPKYRPN